MSLLTELDRAGLTGRGGAAFSTAVKIRAAHATGADLIVNACDGEIGAAKDAWIVEHALPQLIRGALLVAPAHTVYAAHRGSDTATRLTAAGLDVLTVPPRYVSSEESSLISLLHGGLARPVTKRAPLVAGGQDSGGRTLRPTVVLNAETVLRIGQIADHGADWFASHGTSDDPGPRLVALTGHVARPQVVETAAGVRLSRLLDTAGDLGGDYVLVGGLGGVLLTMAEARAARWSRTGLAAYGGSLGPGVVDVLDPSRCPIEVVGELLTYAAGESAGQCGPCMFGLPSVADDWAGLAADPSDVRLDRLRRRLGVLPGRGACKHPDGVARFAGSALRVLAPHLGSHRSGACSAVGRKGGVLLAH